MTCDKKEGRSGGILIALALFFAVIGILFGLGRLKAHEFQVTRRIDRTYQIEKILATRSLEAVIRTTAQPEEDEGEKQIFPWYTNRCFSWNSGEAFICAATPTPYKEYQNMDPANFDETWGVYPHSIKDKVKIFPVVTNSLPFARFQVDEPKSNVVYTGVIFKNMNDSWLYSDFGYLYSFRWKNGNEFGKMRMYLVGSDDETAFQDNKQYANRLSQCSWIQLELDSNSRETLRCHKGISGEGGGVTSIVTIVSFLKDGGFTNCVDSTEHETGLLLSQDYLVAYMRDASKSMYFSERLQLSPYIQTNDFKNVWIVLEHEFETFDHVVERNPTTPPEELHVLLKSFSVKAPVTYELSVCNKKSEGVGPTVMTWLFQTQQPNEDGSKKGKQCLLDTFGTEPVSLKRERRGLGRE